MRAEQLQLALRPRPRWEAVDLGVRMTQAAAGSLARAYLPFAALVACASLATLELAPWLPVLLLTLAKPWLERGLLFVFARQVFGDTTDFSQAWAARAAAPWGQILNAMTFGRLVPWRAFVAPVAQLEGQRGAARRRRVSQLAAGQRGGAMLSQLVFGFVEVVLTMGLLSTIAILTPGIDWNWLGHLFTQEDEHLPTEALLDACYAVAMIFVTPFHAAAGFAMYLNRRADLEAWDVEQDLREAFVPAAAPGPAAGAAS